MTRQEYMLAVLAAANGEAHTPVQAQKLFFILDKNVPDRIGGARFDFQPHHYGPYDKAVYEELRALGAKGQVAIAPTTNGPHIYWLTREGLMAGQSLLGQLAPATADYIRQLSAWVRGQSFESLVSSIYHEFPLMSGSGVFRGSQ